MAATLGKLGKVSNMGNDLQRGAAILTQEVIAERLTSIDERVDRLLHLVDGNGEPGLRIRVDRLEQHKKHLWATATALGGVAGWLVDKLL